MDESQEPAFQPDSGVLKLRRKESPEETKLRETSKQMKAQHARKIPQKKAKKKKNRQITARTISLTLGPCLLGLMIFGLFLAHQKLNWEILTPEQALLTRNIGMVVFLVVVIVEAFTEDILQGILCLFLPPFTFLYGLFFADAGPIRGLTISILLFLGTEMFLLPDEALVPTVQTTVNDWIQSGQDKLIHPDGRPEAGFEK